MNSLFAFGMPGLPELLIVAFIALLLFGKKLPGVMHSMGRSITEFKKGVNGIQDEIKTAASVEKDLEDGDDAAKKETE